MRLLCVLVVLCVVVAPAPAELVTHTYEVTSGTLTVDVEPNGLVVPDPVIMALGGTFSVTFDTDDGIIGESDTCVLTDADLYNIEELVADLYVFGYVGTLTAPAGNLYISDFSSVTPGHLAADGSGSTQTNVFGGGTIYVFAPGFYIGWAWDSAWSEHVETYNLDFDIVGGVPQTVTIDGGFTYRYMFPGMLGEGPEFGQSVEIEAQLVPEPTLFGLIALGVGGVLRRRR